MKLYDYLPSGNGYKVRLLLAQLGHRFTLIEKDITKGETRTPDFLALNPNGRIPVLELDDGRHLSESDAILFYLAEGTPFLPAERFARADVLRAWLHVLTGRKYEPRELEAKMAGGYQALDVMERHLAERRFFVAERYTIADIALYAYTHVAHEGDFHLGRYPHIRTWLPRVASQPGHVPITQREFD